MSILKKAKALLRQNPIKSNITRLAKSTPLPPAILHRNIRMYLDNGFAMKRHKMPVCSQSHLRCAKAQAWSNLPKNIQNVSLRSEEHTSELQSRENLVCRLLLEKKNQQLAEQFG